MKAIINRQEEFGSLNGVLEKNDKIRTLVNKQLKLGKAQLLIDTEETLMYELDCLNTTQSVKRNAIH